jgi:hypothetical protein
MTSDAKEARAALCSSGLAATRVARTDLAMTAWISWSRIFVPRSSGQAQAVDGVAFDDRLDDDGTFAGP